MVTFTDGLMISIWLTKRRKEFYGVAFNMSAPAVSIWLAAGVYYSFPQSQAATAGYVSTSPQSINYCFRFWYSRSVISLINSSLIAFAVAFETKRRPSDIWRTDFLWLSLNYFGRDLSVSALLVVYTRDISYTYIAIIIPLLTILYFTFKIPMARVEDTTLHLKKVNSLYLSTIENAPTAQ